MSDFTFDANFEDTNQVANDDPAAEFLAREKETLAGLEDEFEAIQIPSNAETQAVPAPQDGLLEEFDPSPFSQQPPQVNGVVEAPPPLMVNSAPKASPVTPAVKEEPEKIRKWREEQKKLLEEKDAEEACKKEELRAAAKKELEDWYARYKEQIEKSKLNNRNTEKEWVAERDSEAPPGQEWERIAKLCDFNPKSSRNSKDTSRMRSIILQLKQSPPPPAKS